MSRSGGELKTGIVLNYINIGIGNLIPIFYTPVMLRLLGQEEYGLYKLSGCVTSYLGLMSLGIGAAVTRYLIKASTEGGKDEEERMLGLFLVVFRVIAVVTFVVGMLLVLNLEQWYSDSLSSTALQRMKILVAIMVCNTALSFSVSPYMSVVTVHEKYVFYQCMNILNTCVVPILNIVALFLGYASVGLAMVSLTIALIVRLVYYLYIKNILRISPRYRNMPTKVLKEILMFSFWIFVANVVSRLYNATDTMLIGARQSLGVSAVAVYNIGTTFNTMIFSITAGVSGLLAPKTNKMVFEGASNKVLTDFAILVGRLQSHIVSFLICGFILFGNPLICFYVGEEYREAYWVTLFIAVPSMINLSQSVCLNIVIARNQHRFRSIIYLFIAIVNVFVTWAVLDLWGIRGAAFVTGVSIIVGHGLLMNWYYSEKVGIEIKRFWRSILSVVRVPMIVCGGGLMILSRFDLYNLYIMLMSIVIFAIVLIFLQWKFAFNEYEKGLLLSPLRKIRGRIIRSI